ncbi:MAG: hypothetical protein KJZ65_11420 [Phycisphaerales bacterium]|nr:hypothetical protein [Phycisphaerales bacterium]
MPDIARLLKELEDLRNRCGRDVAPRKIVLIKTFSRSRLRRPEQVLRLHEALCFIRAYPDSPAVLQTAEAALRRFEQRPDFRNHRAFLADSGIAGTDLNFRFYWLTASWAAGRWPGALEIDWDEFEHQDKLEEVLHLLATYTETPALDTFALPVREWIKQLKSPRETDADFVVRRFQRLKVDPAVREQMYDAIDIPMILRPGKLTPARTRERWEPGPVVYRDRPLDTARPDLRPFIANATMTVRPVGPREGRRLIQLANECMVPRHRDLLAFLHADERDVRMVDFGDGFAFACMGVRPERRLMLEAVYAFLTINNGVPIGYVLNSAFFNSAEVAYNVFETFRGGEAARNYGRLLAMVHHLFGADSFAVDPYQLGHDNAEGQASGAWWFYYKLGFRPRDAHVRKLVRQELAAMRRNPRHRTTPERLNEMAAAYMFFQIGPQRRDVLGEISLGNIGMRASNLLARRGGSDREGALAQCAEEASRLLGVRSQRGWTAGEREAWTRWAPLALALPGVKRWSGPERRALAEVMRAKGGRRESDYVRLFDQHARLRSAMLRLAHD